MFKKALKLVKKYDRIIIHRHKFPDGDALGSQLGLAALLKDNFKDKQIYVVGDESKRLWFMNAVMDDIPDEYYKGALAIILDCGAEHLVCDDRYKSADKTLRFDHHIFSGKFCDFEVIDSSYESACGLIAAFAKENKLKLSLKSATPLYTGMVTDSGRFVFDSTSSRTFSLASFLMSQPIDLGKLYYDMYARDFAEILSSADNIKKIKFTDCNVAYIYTTRAEIEKSGEIGASYSSKAVSYMKDIKGVYLWVAFTECDDCVRVELRSNKYNINPIAVKYGGGGHQKASGCSVADKAAAMQVLADLDELSKTNSEENQK